MLVIAIKIDIDPHRGLIVLSIGPRFDPRPSRSNQAGQPCVSHKS